MPCGITWASLCNRVTDDNILWFFHLNMKEENIHTKPIIATTDKNEHETKPIRPARNDLIVPFTKLNYYYIYSMFINNERGEKNNNKNE